MNQVPAPHCPHCGRNLSTDDLRGVGCPSCGTALPHHARAAQQVALVNQVLAQHMAAPPPYATHGNPHYVHAMQQANVATRKAVSSAVVIAIVAVVVVVLALVVVGAAVAFIVVGAG